MADKTIGELNNAPGTVDDSNTLFVVQQSGTAYKLDGHAFIVALTSILDGHGGIKSIVYTAPTPPSLDGTMVITLADNSTTTLTVKNGKGITSVAKTGTSGLVDTYTITYNDSTTSTFTVTNGAKGDTGDAWYVWIRYASQQPTQDADMGTTPDDWMGVYSGTASTAPTHYTDYDWFQIKGDTGNTGAAATVTNTAVEYQQSASGTTVPIGSWSSTVPTVLQGNFLWTRTTVTFNSGSPIVWYSVAYTAVDGQGSPGTATPLVDSGTGVVGSANAYSRQDHQHPLNVDDVNDPQMDGTASVGISTAYAKSDHVHPTDTSRAAQSQLDNLFVSGATAYTTLADLVSFINGKSSGDLILARASSAIASTFLGATVSVQAVLLIVKASSNNAYYYAFNRDYSAVGNISLSNSTVDVAHSLAKNEFQVRSVTWTYSCNAGAATNTNLKTLIDDDMPSGYEFIALAGYSSGNVSCLPYHVEYINSNYALGIRNVGSSNVSNQTAIINYLCKPT